ncbi:hypothetical protein DL96DRAFT_1707035 [Flagelloscypha sp. PMI_526]|nr:hypothetical protein DL96DRAFT_1707035 [Flagelloscypha sp. PMI_526]
MSSPLPDGARPFDSASLKPYIKQKIQSTLSNVAWDKDKERVKELAKEIGDRVKHRCMDLGGKDKFKYIILTQVTENLGQGGRADLSLHWEDADSDSIICVCIVFAIKTGQ